MSQNLGRRPNDPSPEEIREAMDSFSQAWSEEERRKRRGLPEKPTWEVPVVEESVFE